MALVAHLFRRNLQVFWRDRVVVVFTATAPAVMLVLFTVFFREMTASQIVESMTGQPRVPAGYDMTDAYALCDAWLFASCVVMSTFACSLGMLASFVMDRADGRFSDYLVSPVRRGQLTAGYVMSSVVVAVVVSSAFLALGQLWAAVRGQALFTPAEAAAAFGAICLSSVFYAAVHVFAVTFLASQGGLGGYSLISGIAVGFFSYCYVPPSMLSEGIQNVVGALPFAQGAALIRRPGMAPALDRLSQAASDEAGRAVVRDGVNRAFGADLLIAGRAVPAALMVLVLAAVAALAAVVGARRMGRVMK